MAILLDADEDGFILLTDIAGHSEMERALALVFDCKTRIRTRYPRPPLFDCYQAVATLGLGIGERSGLGMFA